MDFLDSTFASVNRAQYAGFLGIDIGQLNPFSRPKSTAQRYMEDLEKRYPFSDFCDRQSELVAQLRVEATNLWSQHASVTDPATKGALYEKSVVIDAYIKKALTYLDKISCPKVIGIVPGGLGTTTDQVLVSSFVKDRNVPVILDVSVAEEKQPQLIKGMDNQVLKYAACAIIVMAAIKLLR
jgi:hypothetical protein